MSLDSYIGWVDGVPVHAFEVLGDPVRRRVLELLADGERSAGEVAAVLHEEFGISQPAASQHVRVLRENGFARVRVYCTATADEVAAATEAARTQLTPDLLAAVDD